MKIRLTEIQLDKILNEMAYPSSFNFETFKNLSSYSKKIEYCNLHLQRLASGSSRVVYKIDNEKALKLAKNNKGIAQNECEYNSWAIQTGIAANVFECDTDFLWIEMELAKKCKPSDFKRLIGYDFNTVQNFLIYIKNWYSRYPSSYDERYTELFDKIVNEEAPNWDWFKALSTYIADTQLEGIGDLQRISSWGIVNRNGEEEIVLVDFGLNDDIYQTFYRK